MIKRIRHANLFDHKCVKNIAIQNSEVALRENASPPIPSVFLNQEMSLKLLLNISQAAERHLSDEWQSIYCKDNS